MSRKRAEKKQKDDTGIYVAIIGLVGTILVAVMGYLTVRTQIELPIAATQTAEARLSTKVASVPSATPIIQQPTSTSTLRVPSNTPTATSEPQVVFLGQDGTDFAVSGCAGGGLPLGKQGTVDNHIRLSSIKNLDRFMTVDIFILPSLGHWQYPCKYPWWQIVVKRTSQEQLDLYFEPNTSDSSSVTFTIILKFSDETTLQFAVMGASGRCCFDK